MTVDLPSKMSVEEATEILTDVIASSLGISPEDVQVSVNTETGEVEYIVTGDSFEEHEGLRLICVWLTRQGTGWRLAGGLVGGWLAGGWRTGWCFITNVPSI